MDVHSQILQSLKEIDGKVDKLLLWKAGHDKEHETIARDINDFRGDLYGNPDPETGIKYQVQRLINCKNKITEWKQFWMAVLRALLVIFFASFCAWLLMLYRSHNL